MNTASELLLLADENLVPESGIHPTKRSVEAGEDLRAAVLRLCDSEPPRARVWSIAPIPRRAR